MRLHSKKKKSHIVILVDHYYTFVKMTDGQMFFRLWMCKPLKFQGERTQSNLLSTTCFYEFGLVSEQGTDWWNNAATNTILC